MRKRWSQKRTTIKVQPLGYRTGSTHRHAERLARTDRGRLRTLYLRSSAYGLVVRFWQGVLFKPMQGLPFSETLRLASVPDDGLFFHFLLRAKVRVAEIQIHREQLAQYGNDRCRER